MQKIISLLFLIFFSGLFPVSCKRCDSAGCECDDFGKPYNFYVTSFGVKTVDPVTQELSDSVSFYPADRTAKMIYVEETKQVAVAAGRKAVMASFFLINAAYACSPIEPNALHDLTSIKIISNTEVSYESENDIIKKGENISNRFLINRLYSGGNGFVNPDEFLRNKVSLFSHDQFFLKPGASPYKPVTLNFDIILTLSDGAVFELKDQVLNIK